MKSANFFALKRAFQMGISCIQLPDDLKAKIKEAMQLEDLLDALFESKYWNFADLRLIRILVISSRILEAKNLVNKYKETFFGTKLIDALRIFTKDLPSQCRKYACKVGIKLSKEPDQITIADLAQNVAILEAVIMDIEKGSCALHHIEEKCVKIHLLIPIQCSYHAYKSALSNRHRFHSLHIQYIQIESYPVIYDRFTIQPTVLSALLHLPNSIVCKCVHVEDIVHVKWYNYVSLKGATYN